MHLLIYARNENHAENRVSPNQRHAVSRPYLYKHKQSEMAVFFVHKNIIAMHTNTLYILYMRTSINTNILSTLYRLVDQNWDHIVDQNSDSLIAKIDSQPYIADTTRVQS
jgi:hypothetical protein